MGAESIGFSSPFLQIYSNGARRFQRLQAAGIIVSSHERDKVVLQIFMSFVVVPFDRRVFDRTVHPLDLAVRSRVIGLRQPVLDIVLAAGPVEDMGHRMAVLLTVGELYAFVGQNRVEPVGQRRDQVAQELSRGHLPGLRVNFDESEFRGPVGGCEQISFPFS